MVGILILEDDSNILELIKSNISSEIGDFQVYSAADPIEALGVFERNKLNIKYLICDYLLPIQNGRDFVDIVKEQSPNLKICMFTGDIAVNKKMIPSANEVFYKHEGFTQLIDFLNG
ncbi:MAG: response regulator [Bdellovibrionales bacterium]|nr:response regulator [Bdellovibrionales bacterium]